MPNSKILWRTKVLKFGTKNELFEYFWPKMLYMVIFRLSFLKKPYLKSAAISICLIAKYREMKKMPKFGSKSALSGCFWARILKNYFHIWNQHLQISVIVKFYEETKIPKFVTKNAWFRYFSAGVWKQFCHIWNQHPQICPTAKFGGKSKMLTFGIKNALFRYF